MAMQLALYGSIAWRHPLGIGQVIDWATRFGWDCIDARGMSLGVPGDRERNENAFGYDMLAEAQRGGFAGPMTYEYVNPFKGMPLSYWDTLPEPEAAAQREAEYLRQLVAGLPAVNS